MTAPILLQLDRCESFLGLDRRVAVAGIGLGVHTADPGSTETQALVVAALAWLVLSGRTHQRVLRDPANPNEEAGRGRDGRGLPTVDTDAAGGDRIAARDMAGTA